MPPSRVVWFDRNVLFSSYAMWLPCETGSATRPMYVCQCDLEFFFIILGRGHFELCLKMSCFPKLSNSDHFSLPLSDEHKYICTAYSPLRCSFPFWSESVHRPKSALLLIWRLPSPELTAHTMITLHYIYVIELFSRMIMAVLEATTLS